MPRWIPPFTLGLAAALAITGLLLTRAPAGDARPGNAPEPVRQGAPVDRGPIQTARRLQPMAQTPDEQEIVHQALRLAGHEVDLAFSDALREALENPPVPTPQTRELLAQQSRDQAGVKADQQRVLELTGQLAPAAARDQLQLQAQLDVAKAQLDLDQDELDQATEALERIGGDPQAKIRRVQAAHAAAEAAPSALEPARAPNAFQAGSLLGEAVDWSALRAKSQQLAQVQQDSLTKVQRLTQRRAVRAEKVEQEKQDRERTRQQAASLARGPSQGIDRTAQAGMLASLQRFTGDQRMLTDLGRRIQDEQELAELYGNWTTLARAQQRAALHTLIKGLLGILLVLGLVIGADRLFEHLFRRLAREQKRVGRLLKVVKYSALAAGAVVILLVLFGMPSQMATLFGLAGAGLTVALKDFIVAFFGWFVLVGRNGIHVGDWVEIEGVGGEVVEIGLLRTMLLETGNWSDAGHPTGRIASFVNSFAIEGHFFNFSTSGQWMWDELETLIPAGQDPYPVVDAIQHRVEQETEANARLAEQEWKQSAKQRRVQGFSARPSVSVVPVAGGVELKVRYITRAFERHATRTALNLALMELLHGTRESVTP